MEHERLEPRPDVKELQISGLSDPESNFLASFEMVHIDDCVEWKILPSFGRFPFLTMLNLISLPKVTEVLVPSLEELVLVGMPKLERCSCTSVEGMNSSLRVLLIEKCYALKEFDLFENDDRFEIEQRSWLPGLKKLILRACPHLKVLNPLPPSTICSELHITDVPILPSMTSSSESLRIRYFDDDDNDNDELMILDDKILAFHNLRNLKSMMIVGCQNLSSFSLEGFSHLICLKSLEISRCGKLFCLDVMQALKV
jgi:hypothetical protein